MTELPPEDFPGDSAPESDESNVITDIDWDKLDLSGIETSEAEPLVSIPDPKKSKKEKPKKEKPDKPLPRYVAGKYAKGMKEIYGMVALGIMPFDPQCAQLIMGNAENCADAWDKAAKESPAIRRALQALMEGTTISMLVASHLPIAMGILAHHKPGIIPPMFSPDESEVNNSGRNAA